MPPPPRPRNSASGRPSAPTPMSERQQMALLIQMTSSSEAELSPNSQSNKPKDRNERGETPLHIAAKKGDLEAAKKLLEQGTNPNVTDFAGWTPLHEAANHGHYHLAQLLIKHGANIMAVGFDDVTPLHDAASFGNLKLAKLLIDKGADPLFKNKKGKTPLDIAHPSLANFMGEMANKQQQKKSSGGEIKSKSGDNEESSALPSSSAPSDVYEFVSTPKHSSCSSGDENPVKDNFEKSSDEKSGTDSDTPIVSSASSLTATSTANAGNVQQKRTLGGDQQDRNDESMSPADSEDSKRKKRKDSDFMSNKETGASGSKGSTSMATTNRVASRIGQKPPGPASKTMGLINKGTANVDRKSPCESPKMSQKSPEAEVEGDESKSGDGPKVPPLKIVLPSQGASGSSNTNTETQDGNSQNITQRANKTGQMAGSRNATGLPYVLASSSNSNDSSSNDKEALNTSTLAGSTRSQSPSADSNKSNEDGKAPTSGKSKEVRILRSSQRGGKESKDDRSSNNSSPQLPASSTPSPAAQNTDTSNGTDAESQQNSQTTAPTSNAPATSTSSTVLQTSIASTQSTAISTTIQPTSSNQQNTSQQPQNSNELHPRKRKIKASSKEPQNSTSSSSSSSVDIKDSNSKDGQDKAEAVHPHDQPFTNCYQMYIDLRKQIEQRHRNLHPIEPRPLKGLEDYLMNRRTYSLQGKTPIEPNIIIPPLLPTQMKETFIEQEKERHKLKMKHIVEKEKLVLSKEQEILRVHCKAAQMIANQSQPFSVCTILKDEEVYNIITPEQEEKYRNKNRERSHGRVFYQALKELDDKWDKIKEAMIIRHTNEAESLHAVQKMDYGWKLKEVSLCDYKATPEIEELHVPMVDVSDDVNCTEIITSTI